jgi:hypothetical protein
MTLDANLGADNVERSTEAALSKFVANHGDLREDVPGNAVNNSASSAVC